MLHKFACHPCTGVHANQNMLVPAQESHSNLWSVPYFWSKTSTKKNFVLTQKQSALWKVCGGNLCSWCMKVNLEPFKWSSKGMHCDNDWKMTTQMSCFSDNWERAVGVVTSLHRLLLHPHIHRRWCMTLPLPPAPLIYFFLWHSHPKLTQDLPTRGAESSTRQIRDSSASVFPRVCCFCPSGCGRLWWLSNPQALVVTWRCLVSHIWICPPAKSSLNKT